MNAGVDAGIHRADIRACATHVAAVGKRRLSLRHPPGRRIALRASSWADALLAMMQILDQTLFRMRPAADGSRRTGLVESAVGGFDDLAEVIARPGGRSRSMGAGVKKYDPP
jgi:hypothetical protein